ncbi:hypothetical protein BD410DRAFT_841695 [Rickenella mellea]|uniref:F-box domain-containing protein n=1 Tax=Rickenella mellea TaxID=50990 RepID=A0A4Y7PZF9_9AGAM|nr:hypothetical protein BD410DRAFT_841695 [Rickenella mellea]
MLRQSQPPLQKLTLGGRNMSEGEFIECLQATPQLDYLSITDIPFSDAILDALTLIPCEDVSGGWRGLCPKMTVIWFMECPLSEEHLTRMILSRRGPFCDQIPEDDNTVHVSDEPLVLQSVSVSWCQVNPSLREDPKIAAFIADGLELEIYNGSNSPASSEAGGD